MRSLGDFIHLLVADSSSAFIPEHGRTIRDILKSSGVPGYYPIRISSVPVFKQFAYFSSFYVKYCIPPCVIMSERHVPVTPINLDVGSEWFPNGVRNQFCRLKSYSENPLPLSFSNRQLLRFPVSVLISSRNSKRMNRFFRRPSI